MSYSPKLSLLPPLPLLCQLALIHINSIIRKYIIKTCIIFCLSFENILNSFVTLVKQKVWRVVKVWDRKTCNSCINIGHVNTAPALACKHISQRHNTRTVDLFQCQVFDNSKNVLHFLDTRFCVVRVSPNTNKLIWIRRSLRMIY